MSLPRIRSRTGVTSINRVITTQTLEALQQTGFTNRKQIGMTSIKTSTLGMVPRNNSTDR
jgi:hypothetical protein